MSTFSIRRRAIHLLIFLLGGVLMPLAVAQLQEPSFQHITVEQGLSQSSVYCILQDQKGFMWFATADGLNKYDGYDITVYRHSESDTNSLADNTVRTFIEDRNANLWIATTEAVTKYDRRTGRYTQFSIPATEALLEDRNGRIWIGTARGLYYSNPGSSRIERFQYPQSYHTNPGHTSIKSLLLTREGNIWIGTEVDVECIDYKTGTLHCYFKQFRDKISPLNIFIFSLAEDAKGNIWCSSWGCGLLKLVPVLDTVQITTFRMDHGSTTGDNYISSLISVNDSTVWLGTNTSGVVSFNINTESFYPLLLATSSPNVYTTQNARYLFRDRSGIYWIGTDGDGVYQYDSRPKKFKHIFAGAGTPNSLSGNFLRAIYEDRHHRVWIGTYEHGLTLWDKSTDRFTHYLTEPQGISKSRKRLSVYSICEDSAGILWIGTNTGILKFDERQQKFINVPLAKPLHTPEVFAVRNSSSGFLWLCPQSGLYTFDPASNTFHDMGFDQGNFPSIRSAGIRCLFEDSTGILWLGTYRGGLNRLDLRNRKCTTFTYNKHDPNSISNDMVNTICQTRNGILWIGTEHGLNAYNPITGVFTRYFEEEGISNAFIYGILDDGHGNLWISTNKGISRFNTTTLHFRNYGIEDGVQSNEFNSGASFINSTGEMYFGGINGLNIFNPDSITDNPTVPQIVLTGFKKLDMPVKLPGEFSELSEIQLDYEDGIFSLRFASLEYTNPAKNHYAYMMEGFEQDWIYCGTKHEVRYTHLDPGTYTFHVKGSNNDGVWNEQGISLTIIVIPPFWKTWWFVSLIGLFALATIGGTIRFFEMRKVRQHLDQLERERAMERERSRISQDMHDEIGANLTKIAIISEIARRDIDNRNAIEQHLNKISTTARDIVDSISEIIWAINPKNDRLDNLISFIREYASGFFEGTEIDCRFMIPETIPDYPLSGELRRNILLVVKEALTNIVKHSGATKTVIRFSVVRYSLFLEIEDNGRGFSPGSVSEFGNGLFNMKKRMESINGTCNIHSETPGETRIAISIDLTTINP